jgi:membrane-associated phospholipid phosphatase
MPLSMPEKTTSEFLRANRVFLIAFLLLLLNFLYVLATNKQGDALLIINGYRSEFWDWFFIIGTRFGEPEAYVIVFLVASAYRFRTGLFSILSGITAGIVSGILKVIFGAARPMRWFFDNYEEVWHSLNLFEEHMRSWAYTSFPSGHAASAFALFSFVSFNARRGKFIVGLGCFLVAAQVAFSRMYLLYHFLRDVTAGALLGLIIGILMYGLQYRFYPNSKLLNRGWYRRQEELPEVSTSLDSTDA